ncbi:MAG: Hsp20/alpha crystallin family protein [Deltaproteobacteria bacterium]|nr:Hsp20/alpha crystallin family protein [Deltaproteobacteria bacterium]
MDPFKKQRPSTFDEIEREFGRMLRNMTAHRMYPFLKENLVTPTDVYETATEFIVYMEIPGIDPDKISVLVNTASVTVSGERVRPDFNHTTCIQQLEVEYGKFKRTIPLAGPVEAESTSSTCKNGYLLIRLPKKKIPGQVKITIKGE